MILDFEISLSLGSGTRTSASGKVNVQLTFDLLMEENTNGEQVNVSGTISDTDNF